jgi:hypothetical protein
LQIKLAVLLNAKGLAHYNPTLKDQNMDVVRVTSLKEALMYTFTTSNEIEFLELRYLP